MPHSPSDPDYHEQMPPPGGHAVCSGCGRLVACVVLSLAGTPFVYGECCAPLVRSSVDRLRRAIDADSERPMGANEEGE